MAQLQLVKDRFLGSLVGLAVGDALGAPFEFQTHSAMEAVPREQIAGMRGGGRAKLAPGEWGDDTATALLVAESLLAERDFDPLDIILRFLRWKRGSPRRVGPAMAEILDILESDPERWREASRDAWYRSGGVSSANGALARSPALALFRHDDLERLARETILLCQTTHFDPRCVECSLVLNFFILQLVNQHSGPNLLEQAHDFLVSTRRLPLYRELVEDYDKGIVSGHSNFSPFPSVLDDNDAVVRALEALPKLQPRDLSTSGYCVHTLQTAIWILLHKPTFEEGLLFAVSLGGDTDTQGAVAGALLGARHGLRSIPMAWQAAIRDRPRIVSLAELLHDLSETIEADELARGLRRPD